MKYQHIFGPVFSRRLGKSLGVDLVPFKTCTYDCIYCQLGRTTRKTLERQAFFPVAAVLREVEAKLAAGPPPDYITLSGSGEPTLYSEIEAVIAGLKKMTRIPVAVLTNGSLLYQAEVRQALLRADVVLPSLDAGDADLFNYVNRPHPALNFHQMVEGLIRFREEYRGALWLEVFLLGGVTAIESEVRKLAGWIAKIKPDKIQVNTVTRPPAEEFAFAVPENELRRLAAGLGKNAVVIAPHREATVSEKAWPQEDELLNVLARRPVTLEEIAAGLGIHPAEAAKRVQELLATGKIKSQKQAGIIYYLPAGQSH
ncbi:wyosine [tRNA(Phe)-imidazoG37] synthetase (radical SAM superfamily) [Thermodesulfitimonas autotrophica]|uniref:Wyosine [tRNA(Phe)-imidazoG37] synthetase (Radical SAM superfamily) n=1 Tax=Thermodesulfitimonas autotrophica TaxID=1894989 RepID=A0A3N5ADD6_9THEO|nr:radical SAM protein [Thermodesulfitimonas autotrophica]RPF42563.1 wyosine [tRNA(Phe)-imidazoG37] synthetase (radical SAM superfamily) [Thermodesulfitimonas autotrophica]